MTIGQALHAYLDPLLKKHTAGQLVVYEDLLSSWEACQALCKGDELTTQRLKELHDSQINAYEGVAQNALADFSKAVELPEIASGIEEQTYAERVWSSLQIPDWKVNQNFVRIIVKKRASDYFQAKVNDDKNEEEGGEISAVGTGEDTEDDDDEEVVSEEVVTETEKATSKKFVNKNNNQGTKPKPKKKVSLLGKGPRTPIRGRRPPNRGRGRGNSGGRGQARPA